MVNEGVRVGTSPCEHHVRTLTSELGDSCGNTDWINRRTDGYLGRCSGGPRKPAFAFPRRCQQELRIIVLWILENLLDGALLDKSSASQDPGRWPRWRGRFRESWWGGGFG